MASRIGTATGAPALAARPLGSVVGATLLTGALVVAGAAWLAPSSFATAASALRTAGTPAPRTHPPRDPFKPLVVPAAPAVPGASLSAAPTAPPAPAPAASSSPPRRQRTGGPVAPAEPRPARPAMPVSPKASRHVVGSGETLWQIAVASSAQGASAVALAARAKAIFAANEAAIGPDPSHLLAGTVLVLPTSGYAG